MTDKQIQVFIAYDMSLKSYTDPTAAANAVNSASQSLKDSGCFADLCDFDHVHQYVSPSVPHAFDDITLRIALVDTSAPKGINTAAALRRDGALCAEFDPTDSRTSPQNAVDAVFATAAST